MSFIIILLLRTIWLYLKLYIDSPRRPRRRRQYCGTTRLLSWIMPYFGSSSSSATEERRTYAQPPTNSTGFNTTCWTWSSPPWSCWLWFPILISSFWRTCWRKSLAALSTLLQKCQKSKRKDDDNNYILGVFIYNMFLIIWLPPYRNLTLCSNF